MSRGDSQIAGPRPVGSLGAPEHAPVRWRDEGELIDLRPYLLVLTARWRTIAGVAVLAGVIAAAIASLTLPKWYLASAVVRPISTSAVESRITGAMGALGGGELGGLASSLTGSGNESGEYVAILHGFGFNVALADRHHLKDELLKPGLLSFLHSKQKDPDWAIYRALQKRFDCDYSIKTGNLTLKFEAKSRADAERILGYYIDDLMQLMRTREVRDATSAIESLEAEAVSSPDPVLRAQLYELVAKQVERKKTAQVEADFAFRVLDPPAASDQPSKPRVALDAVVAALLGFLCAVWLVARTGKPVRGATR